MRLTQHGVGAARTNCFPAAKPCDYCNSAVALLFCRLDSAFLCISCDAKVHTVDDKMKHERVWMCEVCEQAPAAFTCKADAAALCFTCDRDIHSANPLARRHERSAVVPFYNTAESMAMKPTKSEPILTTKFPTEIESIDFLFTDSDQYLDFDNYEISSQPYSDSVVPGTVKPPQLTNQQSAPVNRFEIDFSRSNIASLCSHSVSSSSCIDMGVVPDGSEISFPFSKSSIDVSSNHQVMGMDREARVLRYREKRKNRKFEKTIRYASRKVYAETRPRVKGRFAKRTDSAESADHINGILSFSLQ